MLVLTFPDMPEDTSESEENRNLAKELLLSAHLNLSLVYLKVTPAHHFEAKEHALKALKFDESNVKGLFRKGQALLGLGEAEQAMKDFEKIVEAEPQNKVILYLYLSYLYECMHLESSCVCFQSYLDSR